MCVKVVAVVVLQLVSGMLTLLYPAPTRPAWKLSASAAKSSSMNNPTVVLVSTASASGQLAAAYGIAPAEPMSLPCEVLRLQRQLKSHTLTLEYRLEVAPDPRSRRQRQGPTTGILLGTGGQGWAKFTCGTPTSKAEFEHDSSFSKKTLATSGGCEHGVFRSNTQVVLELCATQRD